MSWRDEMQPGRNASWPNRNGITLSLSIHVIVLIAIAGILHRSVKLAPYRLPGTREGVQLLTYYAPGSTRSALNDIPTKVADKKKPASVVHSALAAPKTESSTTPATERGIASSGQSGLGDGNITIALQKYFPYPRPSLSALPHGAVGDVVLNAVIDEHGKIAELTLLQGLGPAIDDEVIQTVNQWVYIPATKNGVPVPSVQELHFHYERRG
jgi:periplasmic protein TonB